MPRRSIKNARGALKARIAYDKDCLIRATTFPINNKIVQVDSDILDYDPTDGAEEVKISSSRFITYDKKRFATIDVDIFEKIHDLSPKAFKLFKYIISNIPRNSNNIVLNTNIILLAIGAKYQSEASNALTELIKSKIVAKSTDVECKQTYTINHNLYFRGNYNRFIFNYNKIYGESDDTKNADD